MLEEDRTMEVPAKQRMERRKSLVREHSLEYEAALRRAIALDIHHAYSDSPYGTFTFTETEEGENSGRSNGETPCESLKRRTESWDDFVERLFDVDESGDMVFKK